jgi:putative membrane protein
VITTTNREHSRWPRWVYDSGEEADYRFSFANERTFLAWIRTALALIAGGVALDVIALSMPEVLQKALAALLVVLGLLCAVAAWVRWALAERAMRRGEPLPASRVTVVLAALVAAVAVAIVVASF